MHAYTESEGPPGNGADKTQDMNESGYEEGRGVGTGSLAPLKSELISLPTEGGGFKACDYVGPEIAAFCNADPDILIEPWLAELLAVGIVKWSHVSADGFARVWAAHLAHYWCPGKPGRP